MSDIMVVNENSYQVPIQSIKDAIQAVIARHEVAHDSGVTVVITTNESVQDLNQTHRGIAAPTDVLSFPVEPLPIELAELEEDYLGDLVIAYPYASEQAARLKHPLEDSLILLVVHGTLHLLGYDHDTPENRAEMWAEQAAILESLNIDTRIVPALEESDHA